MSACNERPQPGHPFAGSLVACHLPDGHDGPHTWESRRASNARRGLDLLLATFRVWDVEHLDSQSGDSFAVRDMRTGVVTELAHSSPGPWVLVRLADVGEFAILKSTGAVYRVGADGAVEDDPLLKLRD